MPSNSLAERWKPRRWVRQAYFQAPVLGQQLCLATLQSVRRLPDRLTVAAILVFTVKDIAHLTAWARLTTR